VSQVAQFTAAVLAGVDLMNPFSAVIYRQTLNWFKFNFIRMNFHCFLVP
jgi:hypothetical protein